MSTKSAPKKARASKLLGPSACSSAEGLLKAIEAKRIEAYKNIGKNGKGKGWNAYWVGRFASWHEAEELALRLMNVPEVCNTKNQKANHE